MAEQITEAATKLALELKDKRVAGHGSISSWHNAFAAYIQQVSDAAKEVTETVEGFRWQDVQDALAPFILPEPVDPLLIEARKISAEQSIADGQAVQADEYLRGKWDRGCTMRKVLAALKRGIELAQSNG